MKNIAIFASGGGSNAEVIMNYFKNNSEVNVAIIVCNNEKAGVLERAKTHNIPVMQIPFKGNFSEERINWLKEHVDLIVLAGYLRKIPDNLIQEFPNKIVNIHPALLPKYGGKGMYGMNVHEAVFQNNEKTSGITIHYVNQHYDEGQIIAQFHVDISHCKSPKEIQETVLKVEHENFASTIKKMLTS